MAPGLQTASARRGVRVIKKTGNGIPNGDECGMTSAFPEGDSHTSGLDQVGYNNQDRNREAEL
jgi:hypothetical protein